MCQSCCQFIRFESEWPGLAFVGDSSLSVDQVDAVGPASIGALCRVAELVEDRRKFDPQFAYAGSCHKGAFLFIPRTGEDHLVFDVALHLPDVAGMRLGNVDDQECYPAAVLLVELIEGGSLPPEWRSSVAAEHQHDGLLLIQCRKLHRTGVVEALKREIRGGIANL